jgi:hypothetical protein
MKRQRLDAWDLITDGGRYWGSHRFDVSEVKALPVRAA